MTRPSAYSIDGRDFRRSHPSAAGDDQELTDSPPRTVTSRQQKTHFVLVWAASREQGAAGPCKSALRTQHHSARLYTSVNGNCLMGWLAILDCRHDKRSVVAHLAFRNRSRRQVCLRILHAYRRICVHATGQRAEMTPVGFFSTKDFSKGITTASGVCRRSTTGIITGRILFPTRQSATFRRRRRRQ
jgi:hypothetical protein